MEPRVVVAAVLMDDRVRGCRSLLVFICPQRGGLLLEMGREPERRAFAWLALDADFALHHPDQLAGDRKSQAGATVFACRGAIGLAELLKEVLLGLRG